MADIIGSNGLNKPILVTPEDVHREMLKAFPDILPKSPDCTIEDLRFLQGQQAVIAWFLNYYLED